jgi:hypothetical protein
MARINPAPHENQIQVGHFVVSGFTALMPKMPMKALNKAVKKASQTDRYRTKCHMDNGSGMGTAGTGIARCYPLRIRASKGYMPLDIVGQLEIVLHRNIILIG